MIIVRVSNTRIPTVLYTYFNNNIRCLYVYHYCYYFNAGSTDSISENNSARAQHYHNNFVIHGSRDFLYLYYNIIMIRVCTDGKKRQNEYGKKNSLNEN